MVPSRIFGWESLLHNEHGDAARPTDNAQMTKFGAIPDAD
jgi:hypothetical protein